MDPAEVTPVRTAQTLDTATHPSPEVIDLPVEISYVEGSDSVTALYSSYWQPEPAELEALMAGGGVKITLIGSLPPQMVEVVSFERPGTEPDSTEG